MRRCHEVDVVRALFLQFQKNFFQAFHRKLPPGFSCRNIVVLAKRAPHRAAAKKHCPRTCCARDARFFPVVQRCPCRPQRPRLQAVADLPRHTVDVAVTRTERAVCQQLFQIFGQGQVPAVILFDHFHVLFPLSLRLDTIFPFLRTFFCAIEKFYFSIFHSRNKLPYCSHAPFAKAHLRCFPLLCSSFCSEGYE